MSGGTPTSLSVCVRDHVACVRVAGRANFASSVDFKKLVQQLQTDGCTEIILDLTDCTVMDSTFLGVLAGAAMRCDATRKRGGACLIELLHANQRVLESLDNLDVLGLFTLIENAPQFSGFHHVENGDSSRVELNRTCFEAHKTLMSLSPENERRFRDATEFFEKNLHDEERKK
jgi:anti-sigma B factor antagonist